MSNPSGVYNTSYAQDMATVRTKTQWGLFIAFMVFLFAIPFIPALNTRIWFMFLTTAMIMIIATHGINILTGLGMQLSMGHAAFMALGAYTAGIVAERLDFPFLAALVAGVVVAMVTGVFFGMPALKVKGFYLALSTFAAQIIITWALLQFTDLSHGTWGMRFPDPTIGPLTFHSDRDFYYLILVFTIIGTFFAFNLTRTAFGRALMAMRDNDLAAQAVGVSLWKTKVLVFMICSIYAGVAGVLYGYYRGNVFPEDFTLLQSIMFIAYLAVGGMGSTLGAVLGVLFFSALNEVVLVLAPFISDTFPFLGLNIWAALAQIVAGGIIIIFLVYQPRGLAHMWSRFKAQYRLWPFPY